MIINVRVIPNSKTYEIIKESDSSYKIKLDASPIEGKANLRLIKILSEYFNIPKTSIKILKGHKNKNKIVAIRLDENES